MKENKLKIFKTIFIPHLRYTINFMDMKYLIEKDEHDRQIAPIGPAYTVISGEFEITVFIENIEKSVKEINNMPMVAHELVHVLQIICEHFGWKFENEIEHCALLMNFMMEKLIK